MKRSVAFVLGGTSSHIDLINILKKKEYKVVLVDYLDNPPAKKYADIHLRISTLDKDLVCQYAEVYKANLIITLCLDQPIHVACYVSEKLGLPIPYSYSTSLNVTNKELMKKILVKNSIPTSRFVIAENESQINNIDLNFPLVIKPVDGTGTIGVKKVADECQLKKDFTETLSKSRDHKVVIEEFMEGKEWNFYYIVNEKIPSKLISLEKLKTKDYENFKEFDPFLQLGTITNFNLDEDINKKIDLIASDIIRAFDLCSTPLLIQTIIRGNEIKVIEIATRLGGTGTSNKLINDCYDINIVESSLNIYLGNVKKNNYHKPKANYSIAFVYANNGIFKKITNLDKLITEGLIVDYNLIKTEGMKIESDITSRNRVATLLIRGVDRNEIIGKINEVMNRIDVLDINLNSILNKKLHILS